MKAMAAILCSHYRLYLEMHFGSDALLGVDYTGGRMGTAVNEVTLGIIECYK